MSTGKRIPRSQYGPVIKNIMTYPDVSDNVCLGQLMKVTPLTLRGWMSDDNDRGIAASQFDRLCLIQLELKRGRTMDDIMLNIWRPKPPEEPEQTVLPMTVPAPAKKSKSDLQVAIELMRESLDKLELALP